jgi:hypothetical protein
MKKSVLVSAVLCASWTICAFSQVSVSRPPVDFSGGQILLNAYKKKAGTQGAAGRNAIDEIFSKGLAPSADNVKDVRTILAAKVTSDEKLALVRLLGSLHTYDNQSGMNTMIAQDISALARSSQKEIARAAVLTYSRLGYYQDLRELLQYSKDQGNINIDEYYGELAHALRFTPEHEQLSFISEIRDGRNKYAHEILAFIATDRATIQRFYPSTQKETLQTLLLNEPDFPQAIGEYGLIDGIRYSTWLHAVASLTATTSNQSYSEVITTKITVKEIDPRKIMAYLASAEGKTFIKNSDQKDTLNGLVERIAFFSKQLPQNMLMREIVQDIRNTIITSKGK